MKKAVAIEYNKGDKAPKVIASGKGIIADNIVEKAKENDVPVKEDKNIVESLIGLELGEEIPPELYEAVANILAFVCDVDKFFAERGTN